MVEIYGIESVTLKSYTPEELRIKNLVSDNLVIELRQTYFHLFRLPFFPLKKRWVGVKPGKYYHLGSAIETRLSSQKKVLPTPVYLYAGSLLVIFITVVVFALRYKLR